MRFIIPLCCLIALLFLYLKGRDGSLGIPPRLIPVVALALLLISLVSMFVFGGSNPKKAMGTLPKAMMAETFGIGQDLQAHASPGEVVLFLRDAPDSKSQAVVHEAKTEGLRQGLGPSFTVNVITLPEGATTASLPGNPVAAVTFSVLPSIPANSETLLYAGSQAFSSRQDYLRQLKSKNVDAVCTRRGGRPPKIGNESPAEIFQARYELLK